MAKVLTKRFIYSYGGEADYEIDGKRYSVRYFANPSMPYAEGIYESEILPAVGTVRYYDCSRHHEVPPPEVVALFPGHVGARWMPNYEGMEYNGPAPRHIPGQYCKEFVTAEGIY